MTQNPIMKVQKIDFHWEMENPFLFCAHHKDDFPPGNKNQGVDASHFVGRNMGSDFTIKEGFRMYHGEEVPGFPVHPHRGFETVTIVTEGFVDHFDSLGAYGRYGQGDVQWMTAGKGCQHAEMFPLINEDSPNPTQLFQVWLNLPKKDKFVAPAYKMLWHEDIPVVETVDTNGRKVRATVIAGQWQGVAAVEPAPNSWAANHANKVGMFLIHMEAGSTCTLPAVSATANRNIYYYLGGSLQIAEQEVMGSNRIKVDAGQEITLKNGNTNSYLLLLEGEPINEPVIKHGPFVMNSIQEIRDAFADYQRTQFGGWPYEQEIPVNPRNSGRFAHYANGTEERPRGEK